MGIGEETWGKLVPRTCKCQGQPNCVSNRTAPFGYVNVFTSPIATRTVSKPEGDEIFKGQSILNGTSALTEISLHLSLKGTTDVRPGARAG
jgi:hypothetical protein